jgi:3'-5' exoribonuclease
MANQNRSTLMLNADTFRDTLPAVFRVLRVRQRMVPGKNNYQVLASLYHAKIQINVYAHYQQFDSQLIPGALVKIRWPKRMVSIDGCLRVDRLVVLQEAEASYQLFDTIPPRYAGGDEVMRRARVLAQRISDTHHLLLNQVFWNRARLGRFLEGPGSLGGHHGERHGNFRHAVEVAELAIGLQAEQPVAAPSLMITAALLHDAGKADEYEIDRRSGYATMSSRGTLIGHRSTVVEWVAVAHDRMKQKLSKTHYDALMHALSAVSGAPEWTGCRIPMSREAFLINTADRVSSQTDLFKKHAPANEGFGTPHKHFKRLPFQVKEAA